MCQAAPRAPTCVLSHKRHCRPVRYFSSPTLSVGGVPEAQRGKECAQGLSGSPRQSWDLNPRSGAPEQKPSPWGCASEGRPFTGSRVKRDSSWGLRGRKPVGWFW